jgi:hypothetical protein
MNSNKHFSQSDIPAITNRVLDLMEKDRKNDVATVLRGYTDEKRMQDAEIMANFHKTVANIRQDGDTLINSVK